MNQDVKDFAWKVAIATLWITAAILIIKIVPPLVSASFYGFMCVGG